MKINFLLEIIFIFDSLNEWEGKVLCPQKIKFESAELFAVTNGFFLHIYGILA